MSVFLLLTGFIFNYKKTIAIVIVLIPLVVYSCNKIIETKKNVVEKVQDFKVDREKKKEKKSILNVLKEAKKIEKTIAQIEKEIKKEVTLPKAKIKEMKDMKNDMKKLNEKFKAKTRQIFENNPCHGGCDD